MSRDADLIFAEPPDRIDEELREIEGTIPKELRGSLLRNGPGRRHVDTHLHMFDREGWIAALQLEGGRARLRARHVETPAFLAEKAAGKRKYRRPFTNLPGGRLANMFELNLANAAAHDVYAWGDRIVATDAPGHYTLDRTTLEPTGPAPVNAWVKPPALLSPMPRIDPVSGRLMMYTSKPGIFGGDTLAFIEVDAQWKKARQVIAKLPTRGSFLHEHAFSAKYWVVAEFGRLSIPAAVGGGGSAYDAIGFDAKHPVHLFVVPRDAEGPVDAVAVQMPRGSHCFHIVNAYDDNGSLVVDVVMYEGRIDFRDLFPPEIRGQHGPTSPTKGPHLVRWIIDPKTGQARSRRIEGVQGEAASLHPSWIGKRHRWAYVPTPTEQGDEPVDFAYVWFHGLAKVDFDDDQHAVWNAGKRVIVSPPAFVPRPGGSAEDAGWLLAWTIDAGKQRSAVVILDAQRVEAGPLATIGLPCMLPAVSHVEWMPG